MHEESEIIFTEVARSSDGLTTVPIEAVEFYNPTTVIYHRFFLPTVQQLRDGIPPIALTLCLN